MKAIFLTDRQVESELCRFCTMDMARLEKRLNRISSVKKMKRFYAMARILGEKKLARKIKEKITFFETEFGDIESGGPYANAGGPEAHA